MKADQKYHLKDEGHRPTNAHHLVKTQFQILLERMQRKGKNGLV